MCFTANAQHDLGFLSEPDSVDVEINFRRFEIANLSEADRLVIIEREQQTWQIVFLYGLNSKISVEQHYGHHPNSRCCIHVSFNYWERTERCTAVVDVTDRWTGYTEQFYFNVRAGRWGSVLGLLEEAIQRMGEEIGDFIDDEIY